MPSAIAPRACRTAADGSLDVYLQHERPDGDTAANWLPAPGGPMRLVLRAYEPEEALIEGRYRCPRRASATLRPERR